MLVPNSHGSDNRGSLGRRSALPHGGRGGRWRIRHVRPPTTLLLSLLIFWTFRGNFAEPVGDDFFGLKELGIADEFGLSSLTVPKRLLKGRKGGIKEDPSAYVFLLFFALPSAVV